MKKSILAILIIAGASNANAASGKIQVICQANDKMTTLETIVGSGISESQQVKGYQTSQVDNSHDFQLTLPMKVEVKDLSAGQFFADKSLLVLQGVYKKADGGYSTGFLIRMLADKDGNLIENLDGKYPFKGTNIYAINGQVVGRCEVNRLN